MQASTHTRTNTQTQSDTWGILPDTLLLNLLGGGAVWRQTERRQEVNIRAKSGCLATVTFLDNPAVTFKTLTIIVCYNPNSVGVPNNN